MIINKYIKTTFIIILCLFTVSCSNKDSQVSLQVAKKLIVSNGGKEVSMLVRVKNNKDYPISSKDNNYYLSYHLLDRDKKMILFDNIRTDVTTIKPGEVKDIPLKVIVPESQGDYYVEVDMVEENVAWFKDRGNKTSVGSLIVQKDADSKVKR
ncbi:hypothetical protein [Paenibacillus sp. GCM10012303]|uniref:hypothetical protein n=1 Tax=Paenibacillus sp. GCM10012303 TaxID=3317340 RepID=UPI0036074451